MVHERIGATVKKGKVKKKWGKKKEKNVKRSY